MFKKLLALVCAFVMLACIPVAQAEDDFASFIKVPETIEYRGGVVMRGHVKGADTSLPALDIAYALTSMPYIVIGQPTTWEVVISGGSGNYSCEATLWRQDLNETSLSYGYADSVTLTGNTMKYTFTKEGRYFWQFSVLDEGGEFFSFQTRPYESHKPEDETNTSTVAGKANWVVKQVVKPGMSTYDRALALHDWLIYNANYDTTYTYYDASGVLLKGTGVCDSYGRAYLMLCTIAGIECIYVSGEAGGGAHGWNMIKLDDGKWYHVDCTWDDPVTQSGNGGAENHDYFCIDDETMSKDHRWNTPDDIFDEGFLPPESEDGDFENSDATGYYDFTFTTWEEFFNEFDKMVAAGELHEKVYGLYVGSGTTAEMYNTLGTYATKKSEELGNTGVGYCSGYGYSGDIFYCSFGWSTPSNYITIAETSLRVSVGEDALIIPSQYYPHANSFTWTSSDTSVATVTATYDADNGLIATVTGVSAGTATITVKPQGGLSDTVTVTVLPAYAPDFDLTLTETSSGVTLDWNTVPGITEYQVIRVANGTETTLVTTTDSQCELTSAQLPADAAQKVYVLAQRKVGGEITACYKSDAIAYGKFTPTFSSSLPAKLKEIDADAFANCTNLTSFSIPSGVTTIGERAFAGCTSLTTIRIPATVKSIGAGAFSSCPLQYAVVEKGSYADTWLKQNCPNAILIY